MIKIDDDEIPGYDDVEAFNKTCETLAPIFNKVLEGGEFGKYKDYLTAEQFIYLEECAAKGVVDEVQRLIRIAEQEKKDGEELLDFTVDLLKKKGLM